MPEVSEIVSVYNVEKYFPPKHEFSPLPMGLIGYTTDFFGDNGLNLDLLDVNSLLGSGVCIYILFGSSFKVRRRKI